MRRMWNRRRCVTKSITFLSLESLQSSHKALRGEGLSLWRHHVNKWTQCTDPYLKDRVVEGWWSLTCPPVGGGGIQDNIFPVTKETIKRVIAAATTYRGSEYVALLPNTEQPWHCACDDADTSSEGQHHQHHKQGTGNTMTAVVCLSGTGLALQADEDGTQTVYSIAEGELVVLDATFAHSFKNSGNQMVLMFCLEFEMNQ
eukprot:PhF_6_TR37638/c0_g1_i3/m.55999